MNKNQLQQLLNNLQVIERYTTAIKGQVQYIDYIWDEETEEKHPYEELEQLKFDFETLVKYINTVCNPDEINPKPVIAINELPQLTDEFLETVTEAS